MRTLRKATELGEATELGDARAMMLRPEPRWRVPPAPPPMGLWVLRARNFYEPPFHFTGVACGLLVAAADEGGARRVAMQIQPVWGDMAKTTCEPFAMPQAPRLIASVIDL